MSSKQKGRSASPQKGKSTPQRNSSPQRSVSPNKKKNYNSNNNNKQVSTEVTTGKGKKVKEIDPFYQYNINRIIEKWPSNLGSYGSRGYGATSNPVIELDGFRPPLYAVSWGWNSDGRSGNVYAENIPIPRQVQNSGGNSYISSAAGLNHSLLVSDAGQIYSFGSGRKGQLGYGNNVCPDQLPKGGKVQAFPRQVSPSGEYKYGCDLKYTQVGCGSNFSVAREVSRDEGVDLFRGLREMEIELAHLKAIFHDSDVVQRAWAQVRQERYRVNKIAQGWITTWGTGKHGQLGLGPDVLYSPAPRVIPQLKNICIIQIAVGLDHTLAINEAGYLWTWGSGKGGKLGHGDFEDRYVPKMVDFFIPCYVEYVAAGDTHSAVLITNKKGLPRNEQLKRISTFGRGGHGRLGNGTNRNSAKPVLVTEWLPSLNGVQIRQIACGGAHTVALAYKKIKKSLVNPWGMKTFVITFGYGRNGQLGNNDVKDSFIPLKAIFPDDKCEIIAEVSAGRSWTLARTIGGVGYSWGKGLRGQLGQLKTFFSLVPKKMDCFASLIQLESGVSHNTCIAAPMKYWNEKTSLQAANFSDIFQPMITKKLKQLNSKVEVFFNCCKRVINDSCKRSRKRFRCITCNINCLCYICGKICHNGHNLVERNPISLKEDQITEDEANNLAEIDKRKLTLKHELSDAAKKFLIYLEEQEEQIKQDALKASKRQSNKKKKKKQLEEITEKVTGYSQGGTGTVRYVRKHIDVPVLYAVEMYKTSKSRKLQLKKQKNDKIKQEASLVDLPVCKCSLFNENCKLSARIEEAFDEENEDNLSFYHDCAFAIQRCARWYIGRNRIKRMTRHRKDLIYEAATDNYYKYIMKPIWLKIERAKATYNQKREMHDMQIEEDIKKKYDYKYNLQVAIGGMDALMYGLQKIFGKASAIMPRIIVGEEGAEVTEILRPTYCFSWNSVRSIQLKLPFTRRIPIDVLNWNTRLLPRFDKFEGRFADRDVALFTDRFLKDVDNEDWRREEADKIAAEEENYRLRAAAAMAILLASKEASKNLIATAKAMEATGQPPPPKGPPSLEAIRQGIRRDMAEAKEKIEKECQKTLEIEDAPFDTYSKEPKPKVRRRHSITDPDFLYDRIVTMRENLSLNSFSKRRNSLPLNLKLYHPKQVPVLKYVSGIHESLDMFRVRNQHLTEFLDPKYDNMWQEISAGKKKKMLLTTLKYGWLNPRLPQEMLLLLTDGGRRRTISEPERLAKHLFILFETRNQFAKLRVKVLKTDKIARRRRSFDMGENIDHNVGITDILGYHFEDPLVNKAPTLSGLRKDQLQIDTSMIVAGFSAEVDDGFKKKNKNKKGNSRPGTSGTDKTNPDAEDEIKLSPEEEAAAAAADAKLIAQNMANARKAAKKPQPASASRASENIPIIWQEHFSEEGHTYYFRPDNEESSWEWPEGNNVQMCHQYQDAEGGWYWYNSVTGETSWV